MQYASYFGHRRPTWGDYIGVSIEVVNVWFRTSVQCRIPEDDENPCKSSMFEAFDVRREFTKSVERIREHACTVGDSTRCLAFETQSVNRHKVPCSVDHPRDP